MGRGEGKEKKKERGKNKEEKTENWKKLQTGNF
jgi:hypothetical protein